MDFHLSPSGAGFAIVAFAGLAFFIAAAILIPLIGSSIIRSRASYACIALGFVGITLGGGGLILAEETAKGERIDLIEEVYGLRLTAGQLADLEYPVGRPGDPETFGSTNLIRDDLSTTPLTLVWDGDQLLLVDEDGAELPHR